MRCKGVEERTVGPSSRDVVRMYGRQQIASSAVGSTITSATSAFGQGGDIGVEKDLLADTQLQAFKAWNGLCIRSPFDKAGPCARGGQGVFEMQKMKETTYVQYS